VRECVREREREALARARARIYWERYLQIWGFRAFAQFLTDKTGVD